MQFGQSFRLLQSENQDHEVVISAPGGREAATGAENRADGMIRPACLITSIGCAGIRRLAQENTG
jgi:hypothetical protein